MMSGKSSNRDWSMLGWAVVLFSLAILTVYRGFESRKELETFERTAVTVTGVVTSASMGFQSRDEAEPPSISYEFTVNGKEYTGNSQDYIPKGNTVEIRYLPKDPSTNLSVDHNESPETFVLLPILFGGIGMYLFMFGFSDKTAKLAGRGNLEKIEPTSFSGFLLIISGSIASYLLFNEYVAANSNLGIYFRLYVFLSFLQVSCLAFIWKNRIVCGAYVGLAIFFKSNHFDSPFERYTGNGASSDCHHSDYHDNILKT
jgi:hypothetical protein